MTAINRLSNKATLADNDLIPIWDGDAGRTRSVNAHSLAKYVSEEIDAGIYVKSGVYSNGVLTLTYNNGTTMEVDGLPPDGLTLVKGENQFSGITSLELGENISATQDESGNTTLSAESGSRTVQPFVNEHTIQVPYSQGFVGDVFLLTGDIDGYSIIVDVNGSSSNYQSVGLLKIDENNEWSTDSKRMGFKDDSSANYLVFDETVDAWVLGELGDHTTNYRSASNKTVLNNNGILPGSFGSVTIDLNFDSIESVHFSKSNPEIEYDTVNQLINVSFLGKPQVGFLVL